MTAQLSTCMALMFACGTLTVSAQNLIVNGGFENTGDTFVANADKLMSLPPGSTTIPGWTTLNAELIWARNDNIYAQSPFGSFFLDLTGYHDFAPYAGVAQTIVTTPGRSYRLSLHLGSQESVPVYSGPVSVAVLVNGLTNNTLTFAASGTSNQWGAVVADFLAVSNSTSVAIVGTFAAGGAALGLDDVSVVALPPALAISPSGPGQVQISWTPGSGTNWVLQETLSLTPTNWTDSASGSTNPVTVPTAEPERYYRLFKPCSCSQPHQPSHSL